MWQVYGSCFFPFGVLVNRDYLIDHVAGKKTGNWLQSCDPQKSDWVEDTEEFFEIVDGVSIIMLQAVQWER